MKFLRAVYIAVIGISLGSFIAALLIALTRKP